MEFKKYRRVQEAELRPYIENEDMNSVTVSAEDTKNGSPREGDMIARNPANHKDQWLVNREYFTKNFEQLEF